MFDSSDFEVCNCHGFKYLEMAGATKDCNNLIFLHGMFGGLSNYDLLLKCLHGYHIFVPAIPIYEFNTSKLTISRLTKWLRSFCMKMNISKPILLGNSLGGHLALDYTLHYPQSTTALILTGSSGLMENNLGSSCPRRHDREYIRKQAARTFYEDIIDDSLLDDIMNVITTPSKLRNVLAIARDTHEYNMENYLSQIGHEVLLVWGRNDEITPPKVAKIFLEKLPDARLRWIEKCGHAPMMEHPKRFALFLNEFMTELNNKNNISDYEKNYSHS